MNFELYRSSKPLLEKLMELLKRDKDSIINEAIEIMWKTYVSVLFKRDYK